MDALIEYKIPYKGLSDGIHSFNFTVDSKFFEAIGSDDIAKGLIKVDLVMDKQSRMLVLDFNIKGAIVVDCDRCAEDVEVKVKAEKRLVCKFINDGSDSEDILFLDEKDAFLDLSIVINEFILLSLPMRKVHPDDKNGKPTCNAEQLERLKKLSVTPKVDSPWEALKNLNIEEN